jgi:hypothetical protein
MDYAIISGAAIFFLLHLMCETVSSFVKYNFVGLGRHMQGISIANMFAIISRGFIAIYGLLVAYIVERGISNGWIYGVTLSLSLLIGSGFSLWFSKIKLSDYNSIWTQKGLWNILFARSFRVGTNGSSAIRINKLLSLLLGMQFVAIVIAYGLCFKFTQHRLLIISLVPVIGMIGTMVTVMFVEPRLARIIDKSSNAGYAVSQEFLYARSISFFFSAFALLMLTIVLEI